MALEKAVQKGTYQNLVADVLKHIEYGLEATRPGGILAENDNNVYTRSIKRLKKSEEGDDTHNPASRVQAARFALGGNDSTYLQNAVALLCAGSVKDDTTMFSLDGIGSNMVESVRRAVLNDIERKEQLFRQQAPNYMRKAAKTISWLLHSITYLRDAVFWTISLEIDNPEGTYPLATLQEVYNVLRPTASSYDEYGTGSPDFDLRNHPASLKDIQTVLLGTISRDEKILSVFRFVVIIMLSVTHPGAPSGPFVLAQRISNDMRQLALDWKKSRNKIIRRINQPLKQQSLIDQRDNAVQQLQEATEENSELLKTIAVMKIQLINTRLKGEQSKEDLQNLTAELQAAKINIDTLNLQNTKNMEQINELTEKIKQLETVIDDNESESQALQSKIDKYESVLGVKNNNTAEEQAAVDTLLEEIEGYKYSGENLLDVLKAAINEKERLQLELSKNEPSLRQEIEELKKQIQQPSLLRQVFEKGKGLLNRNLAPPDLGTAALVGGGPFVTVTPSTAVDYTDTMNNDSIPDVVSAMQKQLNNGGRLVSPTVSKVSSELREFALYADIRGLAGQIGPTEIPPDDDSITIKMAYEIPTVEDANEIAEFMPLNTRHKHESRDNDHRVFHDVGTIFSSDTETVLATLRRDYAIVPMISTNNGYIEQSCEVRWSTAGANGAKGAKVSSLEHAAARCASQGTRKLIESRSNMDGLLLLGAAASLKMMQLRLLTELRSNAIRLSVDANSEKHQTRPSANFRNTLRIPFDAGIVKTPTSPSILDGDWKNMPFGESGQTTGKVTSFIDELVGDKNCIYAAPDATHLPTYLNMYKLKHTSIPPPKDFSTEDNFDDKLYHNLSIERVDEMLLKALAYIDTQINVLEGNGGQAVRTTEQSGSTLLPLPVSPAVGSIAATRQNLWNDLLREISISNDRLWVFVRTLSGVIGEEASTLLSNADEKAQRAQRQLEAEQRDISKRVADFHSKLIESVVGGMLRTSKLEMYPEQEQFVVVDAEMGKELRALASGESGRPFFEANVAIKNILENNSGHKTQLSVLLQSLTSVVHKMHCQLTETLQGSADGSHNLTPGDLASPRNSYFVSLRDDVTAAIRTTVDRFHNEMGSRRPSLWELVEGASPSLSLRFAELVGHVLVQTRNSTGVSAMYISVTQQRQTAFQARMALMRLISEARKYVSNYAFPNHEQGILGLRSYMKDAPNLDNGGGAHAFGIVMPRIVVGNVVTNSYIGWK